MPPSPRAVRAPRLRRLRPSFAPQALALATLVVLPACGRREPSPQEPTGRLPGLVTNAEPEWIPFVVRAGEPVEPNPRERRFASLRRVTSGGFHGRAAFSPTGHALVFEAIPEGEACEQVYWMDLGSGATKKLSTGLRRALRPAFVHPRGESVTFLAARSGECPTLEARRDASAVSWPLGLELVRVSLGRGAAAPSPPVPVPLPFEQPERQAERPVGGGAALAFFAADSLGVRAVAAARVGGDLDLFAFSLKGESAPASSAIPLVHDVGPDGDPALSPQGNRIAWAASRERREPEGDALRLSALEIAVASEGGEEARFVTKRGKLSFAPAFMQDGRRVLFTSTTGAAGAADLFVVDALGAAGPSGVPIAERVTFAEGFDGFGALAPGGAHLVFTSSRGAKKPGDRDLFVAHLEP